jgi:hypothetical protein
MPKIIMQYAMPLLCRSYAAQGERKNPQIELDYKNIFRNGSFECITFTLPAKKRVGCVRRVWGWRGIHGCN